MAIIGARARPTTIASYRANLDHHAMPVLGGVRLQTIGPEHLDALHAHLLISGRVDGKGGLAHRSVGNIHLLIRLVLADAQAAGLLRHNPADRAHPPKRKPIRAWDVDQLAHFLLNVRGDHLEAAWRLAAMTGMRRGEIAALRWSNIDLSENRLHVRESRRRVSTEISSRCRRADTAELLRST